MVIDTHQHFWRYDTEEFGWIPDEMASLRRDFLPEDLAPLLTTNHVDGVIAVQARQNVLETRFLLDIAAKHPFVRGVVGYLDLRSPDFAKQLAAMSGSVLVGLRVVLQGQPDSAMEDEQFNRGLSILSDAGLTFDLLIFENQISAATNLVDRHPKLRFILDHFGKPRIDIDDLEPWQTNLRRLAQRPNVWCKISGGITELALDWTPARLKPYLDSSLDVFGAHRLVFGSNWPVCEAAGGYRVWIDAVRQWAGKLSGGDRAAILGGNAMEFYRLKTR